MIYICKVFTPEFKAKLDATVDESLKDNKGYARVFAELNEWRNIHFMLNNEEYRSTIKPEHKAYYESLGIWEPEYTTIELEAQERGLQSQPRVLWNGEIKKIDEINDIFSFTTK